jgi:predicted  nucleic acid-binding Zn-ribbon protein
LAETKAQLALCIIELDQTKAQLDRSNDNIFDLEDEINDVKNERNEAINRMDDAQDRFIEEHHDNARLRVAAESNLAIALQALAELRETHAAVLQELDELSAAVQVADQFHWHWY